MSDDRYDLIQWRRDQALKLRAKGYTIDKISEKLKVSHGTVSNDLAAIKDQVNKSLSNFIENELPYENRLCLSGIQQVIHEAWHIAESTNDDKTRIQALSLAREAYMTQQALLGDSKVLDTAIQWLKRAKKKIAQTDSETETVEVETPA